MSNPQLHEEDTIRRVCQCLHNLILDESFDRADLTTPHEVQNIIRRIRGRSAAVLDISIVALKNTHGIILVQLTRLFNAMLFNAIISLHLGSTPK